MDEQPGVVEESQAGFEVLISRPGWGDAINVYTNMQEARARRVVSEPEDVPGFVFEDAKAGHR